jgi:hypothetical protein
MGFLTNYAALWKHFYYESFGTFIFLVCLALIIIIGGVMAWYKRKQLKKWFFNRYKRETSINIVTLFPTGKYSSDLVRITDNRIIMSRDCQYNLNDKSIFQPDKPKGFPLQIHAYKNPNPFERDSFFRKKPEFDDSTTKELSERNFFLSVLKNDSFINSPMMLIVCFVAGMLLAILFYTAKAKGWIG